MTRLVNLQDREEGFLRDLDRAHLLHAPFSFLLLREELALPGNVAAVAFGGHVLAQRANRFARDHLGTDRGLDHDLEQLARDQLLKLLGDLPPPFVRLVAVNDDRKRVHRLAVQEHVQLHEVGRPVFEELVIERRVAAGDGLQLVVEVEDDLPQRELPAELDAGWVYEVHPPVHAAPLLAELHDRADVLCRGQDPRLDVRLLDVVHFGAVRHQARVFDRLHRAASSMNVVSHVRDRADQVEVELPFEPLAHDLHVQQAEEPAAEPEAQGHRRLRLVVQRSIVELQLGERVPQLFELLGVGRVEPGEHHRFDLAVPRQQRHVLVLRVEHRVPRLGLPHAPDVSDEIAHLAGLEQLGWLVAQLQVADFVHLVHVARVGAEGDLHSRGEHAIHHPNARDRAAVAVVVGVEDQGPQRRVALAARGRDAPHDRFEQLGDVGALLRGDAEDLVRLRADELVNLLRPAVGLGAGEIDLVEHRDDLEPRVQGEKQVGDRLGLDALRRIDHEDRSLARGQGARDLIGEVHMPGGVDQIQLVQLAVPGVVAHPHGVQLDGDAALGNGRVVSVNGAPASASLAERPEFAQLGAVHPSRPLGLETPRASSPRTADIQRVVDLVCPFGFGQRALIVSPPKAGKTVMLQAVAEGVALNNPEAILLILLVDERPEEVSEMIDWGRGEVIASSFDLPHERHVAVADMVFEHARRQVELGKDGVIVLDSLTRPARSRNTTGRASGRTMSGGLDANALAKPKGLFGAARAVPTGGSLSVIATALVETESRMDDVIFEEFKGTGNAELRLVRALADRRIYPAVDIAASGTRREELLADPATVEAKQKLRRGLVGLPPEKAMEVLLAQIRRAKTNAELLAAS